MAAEWDRNLAPNGAKLNDSSNRETGHLADLAVASEPARHAGRFELGGSARRVTLSQ
jgi:hypothetical protein